MWISKEQYFKDMAKALLKGYFAGLKGGKRCRIDTEDSTQHNSKQV